MYAFRLGVTGLLIGVAFGVSAAPPSIQYQPKDQSVVVYQQAAFGVIAEGTAPLFYQWRKDGVPIADATNDQIVLPQARFSQAGLYSVVVSNAEDSVTSAEAVLTVRPPAGGEVDGTFAGGGFIDQGGDLVVQPNGKMLIAGARWVHGALRGGIARLNADGTTDHTFMNGLPGGNDSILALALCSDGKMVVGGEFTTMNGVPRNAIARLNADGSLDTSFQDGLAGIGKQAVRSVAMAPDGSVIVGGGFGMARLNPDGSRDGSFQNVLSGVYGASPAVYSLTLQKNGKVIVGGAFTVTNGGSNIARLNEDGSVDGSFLQGLSGADKLVRFVAVQEDGKVLLRGDFTNVNGVPRESIARLQADGALDAEFFKNFSGVDGWISSVALELDNYVLIAGNFNLVNGESRKRVARLNADGSLESDFWNGLPGANGTISSVVVVNRDQLLIRGAFSQINAVGRRSVARVYSDGTLDHSFDNGGAGANGLVQAIAVQSDGKVLLGGAFSSVNGASRVGIARLRPDGTLDPGFMEGPPGISGHLTFGRSVMSVVVQKDHNVVIGGDFTNVNGVSRSGIARLNPDGTLDRGFQEGLSGANSLVYSVAVQDDGKVVIAGDFTKVNGEDRRRVARLNPDGRVDSSFLNGLSGVLGGVETCVYALALQSNSKLIIGGRFYAVNGIWRSYLARLNPDGSVDSEFLRGLAGPDNAVYAVAVDRDGRVIIGGIFFAVNGTRRMSVARLNADGTLDDTFGTGLPGVDASVTAIIPQRDGKVLIGGALWTVNGVVRNGIARLNADGSLDTSFGNGLSGTSNPVECIALQQDGRVLIGGFFSAVNGMPAAYVTRLWGSADVPPYITRITTSLAQTEPTWEAVPGRSYRVQFNADLSQEGWTALVGDVTATGETAAKTDDSAGEGRQRFYRVVLMP